MEQLFSAIANLIKAMRHINTPGLDTVVNQAETHLNAAMKEHVGAAAEPAETAAEEKANG